MENIVFYTEQGDFYKVFLCAGKESKIYKTFCRNAETKKDKSLQFAFCDYQLPW